MFIPPDREKHTRSNAHDYSFISKVKRRLNPPRSLLNGIFRQALPGNKGKGNTPSELSHKMYTLMPVNGPFVKIICEFGKEYLLPTSPRPGKRDSGNGGGGRIRTHGRLSTYNGFQDRRLNPLGHTSANRQQRKGTSLAGASLRINTPDGKADCNLRNPLTPTLKLTINCADAILRVSILLSIRQQQNSSLPVWGSDKDC